MISKKQKAERILRWLTEQEYMFLLLSALIVMCLYLLLHLFSISETVFMDTIQEDIVSFDHWNWGKNGDLGYLGAAEVPLTCGDSFDVNVKVQGGKDARYFVFLYGDELLGGFDGYLHMAEKSEDSFSGRADFFRADHRETGTLVVAINGEDVLPDISDIKVSVTERQSGFCMTERIVLAVLIVVLAGLAMIWGYVGFKRLPKWWQSRHKIWKEMLGKEGRIYAFLVFFTVLILLFLYRGADISGLLFYSEYTGDEKEHLFWLNVLKEQGILMKSSYAGGAEAFNAYDYPFANLSVFLLIRSLFLLLDDTAVVYNLFYFSCYVLSALTSAFVCRRLKMDTHCTIFVSMLFAFSPFIQQRYHHLFLCALFYVPFMVLLAVRIVDGYYEKNKNRYAGGVFLAMLCTTSGLYYAFFSLFLLSIAFVIASVNAGKGKRIRKEALGLAGISIIGILFQIAPNLLYWKRMGKVAGEVSVRLFTDTERYGLKLIQLLLPRENHRLGLLERLTSYYESGYDYLIKAYDPWIKTMFINENATSTLGLIAAAGLLLSFGWLIKGKADNRKRDLALLITGLILLATVGGFGSVIGVLGLSQLRAYCRISVIIMFLCLLCSAYAVSDLIRGEKTIYKKTALYILLVIGILDQTNDYRNVCDADLTQKKYAEKEAFLGQVNEQMRDGEAVFALPYIDWPAEGSTDLLLGPAETKGILWNVGCLAGREESRWQAMVASRPVPEMISTLRSAGYDAIYLDKGAWEVSSYTIYDADAIIDEITEYLGTDPLIDQEKSCYFWRMQDQ
ncbi:MAG: hypothetical protein IKH46_02540 [Lachnospiraceae bacterium]|nr:hypothetical protein [Lachnospiraceae bacterium]